MNVSRTSGRSRSSTVGAQPQASASRAPAVQAWLDNLVNKFGAFDANARRDAIILSVRALTSDPNDPVARQKLEAFREALSNGRLANVPEAHLAMGEALIAFGDKTGASAELLQATTLAAQIAKPDTSGVRKRASEVNAYAAPLYSRMGDNVSARQRTDISRLYCADATHRATNFPMYRMPPRPGEDETSENRLPMMSAPEPVVRKPDFLKNPQGINTPTAPPGSDVRMPGMNPSPPGLAALDLLLQTATFVGVMARAGELVRYQEDLKNGQFVYRRIPVPLKLATINEIRQKALSMTQVPFQEDREIAQRFLDSGFLEYLEEASQAYWGKEASPWPY